MYGYVYYVKLRMRLGEGLLRLLPRVPNPPLLPLQPSAHVIVY